MAIGSLQELLVDHLRDMYHAEKQLVGALPKMAKHASSEDLRTAFEEHLNVTEGQVRRLEQVFNEMGIPVKGKHCPGMEGIVEEGSEFLDGDLPDDVRDAALISAAQKVEHYEISAYGTACTWADQLGLTKVKKLLHQTLEEEREADQTLTDIAEAGVNEEAKQ